jgi:hypothetical protein
MYSEDEMKRRAQVGMLGGAPVNHAMNDKSVLGVTGGTNSGFVNPVSGPAPPGWDAGNWADPNMHSVKYDAGRLLYGAKKPSEVGSRVSSADFQKRFPGATFDGKDKVDFKGALSDGERGGVPVGLIDVLMAADANTDSSNGIWWGAPEGSPQAAPKGQQAGGVNPMADSSTIARILAELTAASNDEQSPAEREAVLQLLQGGL